MDFASRVQPSNVQNGSERRRKFVRSSAPGSCMASCSALIKRYDKGQYFWELRACAYWEAFEGPKIFIPAIEKTVAYAADDEGYFGNDKTSIIVSDDWRYIIAC